MKFLVKSLHGFTLSTYMLSKNTFLTRKLNVFDYIHKNLETEQIFLEKALFDKKEENFEPCSRAKSERCIASLPILNRIKVSIEESLAYL